jgi:DNA polymerase delta subunit 1
MKKEQLVEECKRLGLEETGKLVDLRGRIKEARLKKDVSIEDIFKNYEQSITKDEAD